MTIKHTGSLIDLDEVIAKARALEPLPANAAKIARLANSPDTTLSELGEAVALDGALTLKVLHRANSASSAGRTRVTSARDAVVRLGMGTVMALATGTRVREDFSKPLAAYGIGAGGLWRHSVAAALAAEELRTFSKVSIAPATFTAALLHDLGKQVLAQFIDGSVREVLQAAPVATVSDRLRVESEVLDVNHAELGALVARNWQLPESIVVGIMFHHEPAEYENTVDHDPANIPLCHAVHLADVVANTVCHVEEASLQARPSEASLRALGIGSGDLEKLCACVLQRLDDTVAAYAA